MANYYGDSRTNYFRVTDEERYNELFSHLTAYGDDVNDFTKEQDGILYHGFGAFNSIDYLTDDGEGYNFDLFLSELQKILPEDEAFIYMESGAEKLCYITGFSIVVTRNEIKNVNIISDALSLAKQMLNNEDFDTQMEY